ncbi:TetR/AcrR family transcriptional regulator [Rhodococcus sp. AD45-ID]|nr:hypothetical protein SZ00_02487 [Rhodococcus sp. AD45]PSR39557.1 TetR/AcrR family transcriptional regulator [Rhodococcus sp. AD45-ID]
MLGAMTNAGPPASLWLRGEDTKRGPRPAYTLEQLADTCVRIADDQGLRAVSMRGVAQELGTAAASLYRYVNGKDDLMALMADSVGAEYDYPPLTGDVRTDVLAIAVQSRAIHRRHPWLSQIQPTGLGPQSMRYLDQMVGALSPTGLSAPATMTGIALLTGWVTSFAAQESAGMSARSSANSGAEHIGALLAHGDYPHLAALYASTDISTPTTESAPTTESIDNNTAFEAGIDALLFGIAPNN